jgi:hypothetical protein
MNNPVDISMDLNQTAIATNLNLSGVTAIKQQTPQMTSLLSNPSQG